MCFTVNVNLVKEELENRYGATLIDQDNYRPSYYYQAFALPSLPAICTEKSDTIQLLKWGLIPSWTKNTDQANVVRFKTFNARSETLETKPSFASYLKSKRCIIPVKGFYEWQHVGSKKIPWYIYPSDDTNFSLAGIYDDWTDKVTGEVFTTFSIVTTDANELMAEIHNSGKRMPVILDKDSEKRWIDISIAPTDAFSLLKPSPSEDLKAYTIGPLINNRSLDRNTLDVIKPYGYHQQNLLF
jgi:putative SOS response-associated peptidase YedK